MGFFDSTSKTSTATTTEQQAIDTAENFQDAAAGNVLNLNLAGAKIGTIEQKKGGQVGGTRGNFNAANENSLGGAVGVGGVSNSGVLTQVTTLDGGAIERAFSFAEKIANQAKESFSGALSVAADANKTAAGKPVDNMLYIAGAALLLLIFFMRR